MPKVALFIKHKTLPGKRDEVRTIWERYMQPNIKNNPALEIYYYCFDNDDPDSICAFQLYSNANAVRSFLLTESYAAYLKDIGPLIARPPEIISSEPVWIKGE